ncbi:MAG: hypothetical protein AAFX04_11780 [Pseudomonadota bacterium]
MGEELESTNDPQKKKFVRHEFDAPAQVPGKIISNEQSINRIIAIRENNINYAIGRSEDERSLLSKSSNLEISFEEDSVPRCRSYAAEDIYESIEKPGDNHPKVLFLYYIYMDEFNNMIVRHFIFDEGRPIAPGYDLDKCIDFTVISAENAIFHPDDPLLDGVFASREVNFENIVFKEKCYVALVLGNPNWRFHSELNGKSAIKFVYEDELGNFYGPNNHFRDGKDILVDLSQHGAGDYRSGFCMINHIVDGPGPISKFKFDIFVNILFGVGGKGSAEKTIIIDPTGENQGPPPS